VTEDFEFHISYL